MLSLAIFTMALFTKIIIKNKKSDNKFLEKGPPMNKLNNSTNKNKAHKANDASS